MSQPSTRPPKEWYTTAGFLHDGRLVLDEGLVYKTLALDEIGQAQEMFLDHEIPGKSKIMVQFSEAMPISALGLDLGRLSRARDPGTPHHTYRPARLRAKIGAPRLRAYSLPGCSSTNQSPIHP